MEKQIFETGAAPTIHIAEILGDLTLKGWDREHVSLIADPEDLTAELEGERLQISCKGDCVLKAPRQSTLEIDNVHGNLYIKNLQAPVQMAEILGCLTMRAVQSAKGKSVHGDLVVKGMDGDLEIERILGNAAVRELEGSCNLPEVSGNLDLRDVRGLMNVHTYGNLHLQVDDLTAGEHTLHADGNIHCLAPQESDLQFNLHAMGESIFLRMGGEPQTIRQAEHSFTLGDGSAVLNLSASGNLSVFIRSRSEMDETEVFESLPEDFGVQIMSKVESELGAQMEAMSRRLNEQMSQLTERLMQSGVSAQRAEEIIERAQRASERETQRAQERIQRAQRKLERKLEIARRKREKKMKAFERRGRRRQVEFDFRGVAPEEPVEPVSEEERLMVLRMLEEKKITLEEANRLLDALEGKTE